MDPLRTDKTQGKLREGPFLFPINVQQEGCSHGTEQLAVTILGPQGRVSVKMDST